MAGNVFERVEEKYRIRADIFDEIFRDFQEYMYVDKYGLSKILNIYYDTENFDVIRESLDKPFYKEKLRLRSYGVPNADSTVFLELKKKYDGVVYKRREAMTYSEAVAFVENGTMPRDTQIMRELAYFLTMRRVKPGVVLCYDRIAMFGKEDSEVRVTFDERIRYRFDRLDLAEGDEGEELMSDSDRLMEIKIAGAVPFWMLGILQKYSLFPTSFSKYGNIYARNFSRLKTDPAPISSTTSQGETET